MTVTNLIVIACLMLHGGSQCKEKITNCVVAFKDKQTQAALEDVKAGKTKPESLLATPPNPDWENWVMACSDAYPTPVPSPSASPVKP